MSRNNTSIIKAALTALDMTGANRIAAPLTGGLGAILMLHHVAPETGEAFEPNHILRITPEYLEQVIGLVDEMGYEAVSLDDIPARIAAGRDAKPFVAFTFDDGYRDNRDYALPIMRRHDIPMAVYVVSDFADGNGELWWLAVEKAIRELDRIDLVLGNQRFVQSCASLEEKHRVFHQLYWSMRHAPESETRSVAAALAQQAGFDPVSICRELVMNWDELRDFANDPLVTIGAHTTSHYALAKLDAATARRHMNESVARIETELNLPCRHFSFPYGNQIACGTREFRSARRLGMMTAVTTEKGLIHPHHRRAMTALPRVSLNGDYQDLRYLRTLLSGAPFALLEAARRITQTPAAAARALFTSRRPATST
ncbi:MAG: polysaccharide deacetylase family protein [Alphaproteobacteria bacterium]|nr:polysaccharide deacetylase family protein [Alphaproteobacteria bacterium]